MENHSPIQCLSKIELFTGLPVSSKEKLATISTHQQLYKKGSIIRQPMDNTDSMIIIDSGEAKIYHLAQNGKEMILGVLAEGDIEGQQYLFNKAHNTNFIEALCDTQICSIKRDDFQNLIKNTPDLAIKLLNHFGEAFISKERNSVLRNIMPSKERVFAYLKNLSLDQNSNKIKLTLKKKDLASYLGITPETFSRNLKELVSENKIKIEKNLIMINI